MAVFIKSTLLKPGSLLALALLLFPSRALPGLAEAGELLDKALKFEAQHLTYNSPGLGGAVNYSGGISVTNGPKVRCGGQGDSTLHTGMYLAAEAYRYKVTGDPQALENARKAARTLHAHLQITCKPYIARYAGPYDGDSCDSTYYPQKKRIEKPFKKNHERRCVDSLPGAGADHRACDRGRECKGCKSGERDGSGYFWIGDTSRDMYDGWFFGYAIAHDLIDDSGLRRMIENDMKKIIDFLYEHDFALTGCSNPLSAQDAGGQHVFRMGWSMAAASVLDDAAYLERYEREAEHMAKLKGEFAMAGLNKYINYYALTFYHRNTYLIMRYDTDEQRTGDLLNIFESEVRPRVKDTYNVFFDYIYMAMDEEEEGLIESSKQTLADFPGPLKLKQCPQSIPSHKMDPWSYLFALIGGDRQAVEPFPIESRCVEDFMWQRSPYKIPKVQTREKVVDWYEQRAQGKAVEAGRVKIKTAVDYLLAYWMGRYHEFIGPED
jgi:hypothetical protein